MKQSRVKGIEWGEGTPMLTGAELHLYALTGARAQLERILTAFPVLKAEVAANGAAPLPQSQGTRKHRPPMSAEQKARLSKRMRKVWKARRAAAE